MVELAPIPVSGILCNHLSRRAQEQLCDCVDRLRERNLRSLPDERDITCAAKTTQQTAMPTCSNRFIVSPISPPAKASVAPRPPIATTEMA